MARSSNRSRASMRRRVAFPCLVFACAAVVADEPPIPAATEATTPTSGHGGAVIEVPAVSARHHRLIYACRDDTIPMFSDRPCIGATQTRVVSIAPPAAGRSPTTEPAPPRATTRPRPVVDPAPVTRDPSVDRCLRLREQLEAIDDRMRSGYSAREAAHLWQRWRDAKARLHDAHC
jgi:hypothetical protein